MAGTGKERALARLVAIEQAWKPLPTYPPSRQVKRREALKAAKVQRRADQSKRQRGGGDGQISSSC